MLTATRVHDPSNSNFNMQLLQLAVISASSGFNQQRLQLASISISSIFNQQWLLLTATPISSSLISGNFNRVVLHSSGSGWQ